MKILLLGSGGREHALAWKISQSNLCTGLFIAPGNAGTSQCGTNILLKINDFSAIGTFCRKEMIEMVVVGPEDPLVNGITDFFLSEGTLKHIMVIGPSKQGARMEGSKAFAKSFMQRHHIPTAAYREFDESSYQEGVLYLQQHTMPVVLKADGLAAGKGVLICNSAAEAIAEFEAMIQKSKFGYAGRKVIVEEYLTGIEVSIFALTDGRNYVLLPEAKDYKRIGEGDTGLNTGGMGAISPVPFADSAFMKKVEESIINPTIDGLALEDISYTGIIFFGVIKVDDKPFVIEYNCRMGDPETEVVIPRLQNDLVELFLAAAKQQLATVKIHTDERIACTVVAVSGGYPGEFDKGFAISGLPADTGKDNLVFHAATIHKDDKVVTDGGRVLCITSYGKSISDAVNHSKDILKSIYFNGMYFRKDIGYEFI